MNEKVFLGKNALQGVVQYLDKHYPGIKEVMVISGNRITIGEHIEMFVRVDKTITEAVPMGPETKPSPIQKSVEIKTQPKPQQSTPPKPATPAPSMKMNVDDADKLPPAGKPSNPLEKINSPNAKPTSADGAKVLQLIGKAIKAKVPF
jgi:hypothetical protein